ncbi:MAG: YcxB family protein [Planctomycetota bacterium]
MKLEYTLRFEDWAAFTLYVNRTVPSLARARKISHIGLPVVYFTFGIFAGLSLGDWVVGGSMMSLAFAWIILYPKLAEFRTHKHLRKLERAGAAAAILGDYCLEITEEGIDARIATAESCLPWASLVGIVEDEGRAYLQLSPTAAVVVPLDGSGAAEFVQECRRRLS